MKSIVILLSLLVISIVASAESLNDLRKYNGQVDDKGYEKVMVFVSSDDGNSFYVGTALVTKVKKKPIAISTAAKINAENDAIRNFSNANLKRDVKNHSRSAFTEDNGEYSTASEGVTTISSEGQIPPGYNRITVAKYDKKAKVLHVAAVIYNNRAQNLLDAQR